MYLIVRAGSWICSPWSGSPTYPAWGTRAGTVPAIQRNNAGTPVHSTVQGHTGSWQERYTCYTVADNVVRHSYNVQEEGTISKARIFYTCKSNPDYLVASGDLESSHPTAFLGGSRGFCFKKWKSVFLTFLLSYCVRKLLGFVQRYSLNFR